MEKKTILDLIGLVVILVLLAFAYYIVIWLPTYDPIPCMNYVGSEMSDFVNTLELTANEKIDSNSFIFKPQSICFNQNEHIMKIAKEKDVRVCSARCGVPQDTCYVMIFHTSDIALGFEERCINLPVYTTFSTDSQCPAEDGYSVIDPYEKIPFGNYILKNVASKEETWPNICVYYKE